MIPVEIVVICGFAYLLYKVVKWWTVARDAIEENGELRAELAEQERQIETLTASLAHATRPASSGN